MLDEARKKGVYKSLEVYTLGKAEDFPPLMKNKFDVVTCAGLVNNNHLDYELFEEFTLALKQGGHAIFSARFSYLGDYWYNETLETMVKENRWKYITEEAFFKYDQLL